jgi:hypothetical protein
MGLTKDHIEVQGAAAPVWRWSFCGKPYTFESYLTFCVEQLDPNVRSNMAQLGLLGYQFMHDLPASTDQGDGNWRSLVGKSTILGGPRLHDVVVRTMNWHIQRDFVDIRQRMGGQP